MSRNNNIPSNHERKKSDVQISTMNSNYGTLLCNGDKEDPELKLMKGLKRPIECGTDYYSTISSLAGIGNVQQHLASYIASLQNSGAQPLKKIFHDSNLTDDSNVFPKNNGCKFNNSPIDKCKTSAFASTKNDGVGKCPPRDMKRLKKGSAYIVTRVAKWGETLAVFLRGSGSNGTDAGFFKPPKAYKYVVLKVGDRITLESVGYSSTRNRIAKKIRVEFYDGSGMSTLNLSPTITKAPNVLERLDSTSLDLTQNGSFSKHTVDTKNPLIHPVPTLSLSSVSPSLSNLILATYLIQTDQSKQTRMLSSPPIYPSSMINNTLTQMLSNQNDLTRLIPGNNTPSQMLLSYQDSWKIPQSPVTKNATSLLNIKNNRKKLLTSSGAPSIWPVTFNVQFRPTPLKNFHN